MIKQYRSVEHVIFIAAFCCLGSLSQGLIINYVNKSPSFFSMNSNDKDQDRNSYQSFQLISIALGAVFGGLIMMGLIQYTSRRRSFIVSDLITIMGTYLTLFPITNYILIGRLIQGFSFGIDATLVTVFIREVSPVQIYGKIAHIQCLLMAIGGLLSYIFLYTFGTELNIESNGFLQIPIYISLIRIAFFIFYYKYETITYLIRNQRTQDARFLIDFFYVNKFHVKIEEDTTNQFQGFYSDFMNVLADSKIRVRLFLALSLNCIQPLNEISSMMMNDQNAVLSISIVLSFISLFIYVAQSHLSLICGRLVFLRVSLGAIALLSLLRIVATFQDDTNIQNYNSNILVNLLDTSIMIFQISYTGIVQIYTPELVPEQGVALCVSFKWFITGLISYVLFIGRQLIGQQFYFLALSTMCSLGLIIVVSQAKETKGLTQYQVEHAFDKTGKIEYKIL